MKIGIITWHFLDNYGSVLQAYSLCETIRKFGVEPAIINYRKDAKTNVLFGLLRRIRYGIPRRANNSETRKKRFNDFRKKHLNETKMFSSIEGLINENFSFNKYIAGSDQIWSPNRYDPVYFLDFVDSKEKYSYSPSVVIDNFSKDQKSNIKRMLNNFKKISVREPKGQKILHDIIDKNIVVTLDPTLLIAQSEWEKITTDNYKYNNYILCYFIGETKDYSKKVFEVAKETGKQIINISITNNHQYGDVILKNVGPRQFLELIKKADVVLTDSYHGVILSIGFNRDFIAFERFTSDDKINQNARIEHILNILDLTDHIYINNKKRLVYNTDYSRVNKILDREREKSLEYISEVIGVD